MRRSEREWESERKREGYGVCVLIYILPAYLCAIAGDHMLSYREFIAVMKGWKLRGYKVCVCVCVCVRAIHSFPYCTDEREETTRWYKRSIQGMCQDGNERQMKTPQIRCHKLPVFKLIFPTMYHFSVSYLVLVFTLS